MGLMRTLTPLSCRSSSVTRRLQVATSTPPSRLPAGSINLLPTSSTSPFVPVTFNDPSPVNTAAISGEGVGGEVGFRSRSRRRERREEVVT